MRVNIKNLFALAGVSLLAACAPQYYGGPADYTRVPSQGNAAPVSPQNDVAPPIALAPPPSYYQQQPDNDQPPPGYYQQQQPPGYYAPPGAYYGQDGGPAVSYPVRVGAGSPLPNGKICGKVLSGCVYNQQQPGYYAPPPEGNYPPPDGYSGQGDGYYRTPSYPVRVPAGSPLPNGKTCGKVLSGCVYNSPYP